MPKMQAYILQALLAYAVGQRGKIYSVREQKKPHIATDLSWEYGSWNAARKGCRPKTTNPPP